MRQRRFALPALICAGLLTLFGFQNCTKTNFRGEVQPSAGEQTPQMSGGGVGGYDGKLTHFGRCPDGKIGLEGEIRAQSVDGKITFTLTRENCSPLDKPQTLPANQIVKSFSEIKTILFNDKVFDDEVTAKRTKIYCRDSSGAEMRLFHLFGSSQLYLEAGQSGVRVAGPKASGDPSAAVGYVEYKTDYSNGTYLNLKIKNAELASFQVYTRSGYFTYQGARCWIHEEPTEIACKDSSLRETLQGSFDRLGTLDPQTGVYGMLYNNIWYSVPMPLYEPGGKPFPVAVYGGSCEFDSTYDCYGRLKYGVVPAGYTPSLQALLLDPQGAPQPDACLYTKPEKYIGWVCK